MNTVRLPGCRVRPLGAYLKALGVLRIIGTQADPAARGAWHGDDFYLLTELTTDDVLDHLRSRYRPTPVVSPWNGGSGFGPKDQQAGIAAIEASDDPRFADYRAAIAVGRRLVADPTWAAGKEPKQRQIHWCRAELPDAALAWLDASVVLTDERTVFPPIFGTGGNDGRLDFSNNFMQRLAELFLLPRRRGAADPDQWLRGALLGADTGPLVDVSAGQYEPAASESGATAASGRGSGLVNPWEYILLIEGGLAFASASARRMGETGRAAMPFCVDASAVGYPSSADAEESRGELWAPVWRRPATADEVVRFIGEGRVRWADRAARTGVDFAKAVATLGVDRGIDRFARHGLVQRNGLSFLAVPLGEVTVGERPQIDVLQQADAWLGRLKRLPAEAAAARRRVEAAEFRATGAGGGSTATALQDVLLALADLETAIGRSGKRSEIAPFPVRGLAAQEWLPQLADDSAEFRIAVALASARDRWPATQLGSYERIASSLALLLRPIELDQRGQVIWGSGPARVPGLGRNSIDRVLADALVRRTIDVLARPADDPPNEDAVRLLGPAIGFGTGIAAAPSDLAALLTGRLDPARLDRLVRALLLLDWRRRDGTPVAAPERPAQSSGPRRTPALATLLPFFHRDPIKVEVPDGSRVTVVLRPDPGWPALLAADRAGDVLAQARHRLLVAGLRPAPTTVRPGPHETGSLLATAAFVRLTTRTAESLVASVCPTDIYSPDPSDTIEEPVS